MPAMQRISWDLLGETHKHGPYSGPGGAFVSAVKGLGPQVGMAWIEAALPKLVDEAKRLCPRDDNRTDGRGPHLQDLIYSRVNYAQLYGEYGNDLPGKDGRVYTVYVEAGARGRSGAHMLVNALQSLKGRL